MSVNKVQCCDGRLTLHGDHAVYHQDGVDFSLEGDGIPGFLKGSRKGNLFISTQKVIFATKGGSNYGSFSMNFQSIRNVEVKQPMFGANYIKGDVISEPDGGWQGRGIFKATFNSGGAIEFAERFRSTVTAARTPGARPPHPVGQPSHVMNGGNPYYGGPVYPTGPGYYPAPPPGGTYAPYPPEPPAGVMGQPPPYQVHENPPPYPGPYSGQAAPYPGQAAPYPGQAAPYPGQAAPYSGQAAPYPGQAAPFPGQAAPYPGQAAPSAPPSDAGYFTGTPEGAKAREAYSSGQNVFVPAPQQPPPYAPSSYGANNKKNVAIFAAA